MPPFKCNPLKCGIRGCDFTCEKPWWDAKRGCWRLPAAIINGPDLRRIFSTKWSVSCVCKNYIELHAPLIFAQVVNMWTLLLYAFMWRSTSILYCNVFIVHQKHSIASFRHLVPIYLPRHCSTKSPGAIKWSPPRRSERATTMDIGMRFLPCDALCSIYFDFQDVSLQFFLSLSVAVQTSCTVWPRCKRKLHYKMLHPKTAHKGRGAHPCHPML